MARHLLVLGGTAEAADLVRAASLRFGKELAITTSYAGRLRPTQSIPGDVRVGGFGGVDALADYLRRSGTDMVIDATHPFAAHISGNAAHACAVTAIPRLTLIRPPWRPEAGDRWIGVPDLDAAASLIAQTSERAFLTTGPGSLAPFTTVDTVWFLVRQFEPASAPLPLKNGQTIVARPPFTIEGETDLMRRHAIDTLVTKQSGGGTQAKFLAARALDLPVVIVERPPPPPGNRVEAVSEALEWLATQI